MAAVAIAATATSAAAAAASSFMSNGSPAVTKTNANKSNECAKQSYKRGKRRWDLLAIEKRMAGRRRRS